MLSDNCWSSQEAMDYADLAQRQLAVQTSDCMRAGTQSRCDAMVTTVAGPSSSDTTADYCAWDGSQPEGRRESLSTPIVSCVFERHHSPTGCVVARVSLQDAK